MSFCLSNNGRQGNISGVALTRLWGFAASMVELQMTSEQSNMIMICDRSRCQITAVNVGTFSQSVDQYIYLFQTTGIRRQKTNVISTKATLLTAN